MIAQINIGGGGEGKCIVGAGLSGCGYQDQTLFASAQILV
jgi:hypothetical protein